MSKVYENLERRFSKYAIPNLAAGLMLAQLTTTGLSLFGIIRTEDLLLRFVNVLAGEWWRLFSFGVLPRLTYQEFNPLSIIFAAFALYILYFMGSALESIWGAFRFNLFVLTGWAITVLFAVLIPWGVFGNFFLLGALFLAFAQYHPHLQFMIFFVIPMKVKWLGWFTWGIFAFALVTGDISIQMQVIAASLTLLFFFGRQLVSGVRASARAKSFQKERRRLAEQPLHTCVICGRTDVSHPNLDFRYDRGVAFCEDHLDQADAYHRAAQQVMEENNK